MTHASVSPVCNSAASGCFRLTPEGRAWLAMTESRAQMMGALSRYLQDVLLMCGTGMWVEQLRQFMPPRSLDNSLQALVMLGLIERLEPGDSPACRAPSLHGARNITAFGRIAAHA